MYQSKHNNLRKSRIDFFVSVKHIPFLFVYLQKKVRVI